MQNAAFAEPRNPSDSHLLATEDNALLKNFLFFFFCFASSQRHVTSARHNNKCSWWEELVKSCGVTISIRHTTRRNITIEQSIAGRANTHNEQKAERFIWKSPRIGTQCVAKQRAMRIEMLLVSAFSCPHQSIWYTHASMRWCIKTSPFVTQLLR